MSESRRIFFLGLGTIGGPIARQLAAAGHEVIVHDASDERAEAWIALDDSGAIRVPTPASGADGADAVIACLDHEDDVAAAFLGADGALRSMREGALLIYHSIVSADLAQRLTEQASARNVHAIDAPLASGEASAAQGTLGIICGGSDESLALARPIMQAYAGRIERAGPSGAGQAAAMSTQVTI